MSNRAPRKQRNSFTRKPEDVEDLLEGVASPLLNSGREGSWRGSRKSLTINNTPQIAADAKESLRKTEESKLLRRRMSLERMSSSATTPGLKNLLNDAFTDVLSSFGGKELEVVDPEERLKLIMTKAKETGMSIAKIFSYFKDTSLPTIEHTTVATKSPIVLSAALKLPVVIVKSGSVNSIDAPETETAITPPTPITTTKPEKEKEKNESQPGSPLSFPPISPRTKNTTTVPATTAPPPTTNPSSDNITFDQFRAGLLRLSGSLFTLSTSDLQAILEKFDVDGDGTISLSEFKYYCYYQIHTVSWKAERKRVEDSGEMTVLKDVVEGRKGVEALIGLSSDNDTRDWSMKKSSSGASKYTGVMHESGPEVFKTTKLFWRTNTTIEVRLFYQSQLDIISILTYNENEDREMPCLYVYKSDIVIDVEKMNDAIKTLILASPEKDDKSVIDSITKQTTWEYIATYLLNRLKLPDTSNPFPVNDMEGKLPLLTPRSLEIMPFLCRLTDDFDHPTEGSSTTPSSPAKSRALKNLMQPCPVNLLAPPKRQTDVVVSTADIERAFSEFREERRSIATMRVSADSYSRLLSVSIDAFANSEVRLLSKKPMSDSQRYWLTALNAFVVKKQVECVRVVLEKSEGWKEFEVVRKGKRLGKVMEVNANAAAAKGVISTEADV